MANLDRLKKRAESLTDEEKEEQERVAAEVLASLQKELKNLTNP
jgi:uncharacterized protein YnzC (UPF0291/DUF896 family)